MLTIPETLTYSNIKMTKEDEWTCFQTSLNIGNFLLQRIIFLNKIIMLLAWHAELY